MSKSRWWNKRLRETGRACHSGAWPESLSAPPQAMACLNRQSFTILVHFGTNLMTKNIIQVNFDSDLRSWLPNVTYDMFTQCTLLLLLLLIY